MAFEWQDNAYYTLSGENRTATKTGGNSDEGVIASEYVIAGKVYFEIQINYTGDYVGFGLGDSDLTELDIKDDFGLAEHFPPDSSENIALWFNTIHGLYVKPDLDTTPVLDIGSNGGVFSTGKILMIAYDQSSGDVWVGVDGTWHGGDPATDPASINISSHVTDNQIRPFAFSYHDGPIYVFIDDAALQWKPAGFSHFGTYRWPPSDVVGVSKVIDRDGNPVSWPVYLMRESTKAPVQNVVSSNVDGSYYFSGLSDPGPYFAMVTPVVSGYRYLTTGEAGNPISAEVGDYGDIIFASITWSSAGSYGALSNDDKTITHGSTLDTAYTTNKLLGESKVYFEAVIGASGGGIGVGSKIDIGDASNLTLSNTSGKLWFFDDNRSVYSGSTPLGTISVDPKGKNVGIAADLSTGEVWISIDGIWEGNDPTGAAFCTAPIIADPYIATWLSNDGDEAAVLDSNELLYPAPAGFTVAHLT